MKKILLIVIVLIYSNLLRSQDVQLIVPKLSIENSIKTLLDARAASFSSYTPGFGVDMYNVKLIYSGSHPLIVDLIPPNKFRIQCGIIGRANVNYLAGNFQINGEGNITIEGIMAVEGQQGQLTLIGTANAVIQVSGVPGFVLNIINSNQFTLLLPPFELATFVFTLPTIPLNYFTTNYPTINITNNNVILGLQTTSNFLIVDQKDQSGNRILNSSIAHWENNTFANYTVPAIFSNLPVNSWQTFRGDQAFQLTPFQKYNNWNNLSAVENHKKFYLDGSLSRLNSNFKLTNTGINIQNNLEGTGIDGGQVEFRDPWFIDYQDPEFGNQLRNRGMNDAVWRTRTSPFNPDYNTVFQNGNDPSQTYKGVFLNQNLTFDPTLPVYSVKSGTQDINLTNTGNFSGRWHKFYFRNWSYDANKISLQTPGLNETAVVFKTSDAMLSANLKGTNLSDDQKAYNTTSQRKFIKTPDGWLHSVYTSLNRVWYEVSSNNGVTWRIMNDGQPLDNGQGKLPSIDYVLLIDQFGDENRITVIVYQEKYGNGFRIKAKSFKRWDDHLLYLYQNEIVLDSYSSESYSNNASPVLALDTGGFITFVWEQKSGTAGLYCRRASVNVSSMQLYYASSSFKLANTNAASINPSITVSKTIYPGWWGRGRHIAWQENNEIKYARLEETTLQTIETPSYASGYPSNYLPSLSLANGKPVLSWTGYYDGNIWKITGEQEDLLRKRALVKVRGDLGWGSLTELGDNINYVNNNSVTSASEKTVIVWSQGSTPQSKWVRRTAGAFTSICTLSHSGIENQVTMGSDFNNMYAMVFNEQSAPFYFIKSTTNFSAECLGGGELNKITFSDSIISYGRSGIVSKNGIEFVFNTGDVFVADSSIQFTFVPDTILFNSEQEINTAARTENFRLEEGVDFYFSNLYYVIRQELGDSVLTEQDEVNFKVELVKESNGEVIGTFDNITYNKNNLEKYASIHYLVNTSGIQAGEYYLRIVTSVADEAGYNLSNIQRDEFDLNKLHYVNVSFKGETVPFTYELSQNYPNPFNPTTTIRYQIPKDGVVMLKVYDILGAEVVTLVNEEKVAGKYEVNFNASLLASGVYIYRLSVNDFVNVKKMVLVK